METYLFRTKSGYLATGTILRGWALAAQGQNQDGLALMREGLASGRAKGTGTTDAYLYALLAEVCGQVGEIEEGLRVLAERQAEVNHTDMRLWEPELHRLRGDLLLKQSVSNTDQAVACFHQALEVSRHQQAKSLELRAATSLAKLWREQVRYQEAYDLLAPVYDWFTEGFDTADLIDAKMLLDELE